MKNILFLLFFVISISAAAQSFKGGFRLGLTGSQVDGDNISGFNKAGLTGGFMAALPIDEYSDISAELLFVQKGSRKNPTKNNNLYKYIMRLNYIEMPFLYRRQLKTNFGFEAGLSFAILIDNKNREFDIYGKIPARPDFEKYEIAAHAGFKYFLNEKQSVNLRYSNSVIPIRKSPGISTYNYFIRGQYNIVLSLTYEHWF